MKAETKRHRFAITREEACIIIDAIKCYRKWISAKAVVKKKMKNISERLYTVKNFNS